MRTDDEWFERFYERHHRPVAAYCTRRLGTVDAADATSQVFVVAWQRRADIPARERELPWLYGVARRVVSHQWRGAGRARRLLAKAAAVRSVSPAGPDAAAVAGAEHQLVREAVTSLGERDREVLLLSAWEGLTHAEIADALGCSVAAVDKRITRAKARLAKQYLALADAAAPRATRHDPLTSSPVRAREGGGGT